MARALPKVGTTLRPYDSWRRYRATVIGYAKNRTAVKLRHMSGRETVASLRHIIDTYYDWS
jgi:hypothetical protein